MKKVIDRNKEIVMNLKKDPELNLKPANFIEPKKLSPANIPVYSVDNPFAKKVEKSPSEIFKNPYKEPAEQKTWTFLNKTTPIEEKKISVNQEFKSPFQGIQEKPSNFESFQDQNRQNLPNPESKNYSFSLGIIPNHFNTTQDLGFFYKGPEGKISSSNFYRSENNNKKNFIEPKFPVSNEVHSTPNNLFSISNPENQSSQIKPLPMFNPFSKNFSSSTNQLPNPFKKLPDMPIKTQSSIPVNPEIQGKFKIPEPPILKQGILKKSEEKDFVSQDNESTITLLPSKSKDLQNPRDVSFSDSGFLNPPQDPIFNNGTFSNKPKNVPLQSTGLYQNFFVPAQRLPQQNSELFNPSYSQKSAFPEPSVKNSPIFPPKVKESSDNSGFQDLSQKSINYKKPPLSLKDPGFFQQAEAYKGPEGINSSKVPLFPSTFQRFPPPLNPSESLKSPFSPSFPQYSNHPLVSPPGLSGYHQSHENHSLKNYNMTQEIDLKDDSYSDSSDFDDVEGEKTFGYKGPSYKDPSYHWKDPLLEMDYEEGLRKYEDYNPWEERSQFPENPDERRFPSYLNPFPSLNQHPISPNLPSSDSFQPIKFNSSIPQRPRFPPVLNPLSPQAGSFLDSFHENTQTLPPNPYNYDFPKPKQKSYFEDLDRQIINPEFPRRLSRRFL
jgi:hypothetical protein